MPYTTDGDFIEEKNSPTPKPIFLYTIHEYDGTNNLNLAQYDEDVVFNGVTYQKFPISFDFIGENSKGEIEGINLKIGNASRLIRYYLGEYDWYRKKVTVTMVFGNHLDSATTKIQFIAEIDSFKSGDAVVEVVLLPKHDVMRKTIPGRNYSRNICLWARFKGLECAYAGAESTCTKTRSRCKELLNWVRYGAFPSVPTRRLYV